MTRGIGIVALVFLPLAAWAEEGKKEAKPGEAVKSKEGAWTLDGREWDFSAVESVYTPLAGTFDEKKSAVIWTLELAKELTSAEASAQMAVQGTPFKPSFLDGEKLLLAADARLKITPISGKKGDRIRMTVQLPKAEILSQTKLVRVGRRTELGF
jgi:hypothetical protein